MKKLFAWWSRRARQARADTELLARLDARTLRDIGVDSWNAHLVARVELERERRLLRLAASRIGEF
jgi:hypothetical protein